MDGWMRGHACICLHRLGQALANNMFARAIMHLAGITTVSEVSAPNVLC